jgi:membrane protease YdiL (CAAX protease family)
VPQWGPFLAVVGVLTVLLLVLSRQSQQFIHEYADRDGPDTDHPGDTAAAGDAAHDGPAVSNGPDERTMPDTGGSDLPDGSDGDARAGRTPPRPAPAAESTGETSPEPSPGGEQTGEGRPEPSPGGEQTHESRPEPSPGGKSEQQRRPEPSPAEAGPDIELTSTVLLANVASTQALFAGVVLAAAWYFSIPAGAFGIAADPLAGGPAGVAVGVGFGVALWLANELSTTVADAVGAAYDETVRQLLAPESARGWVGLFAVVLPLIAVAEELLFRAALIGVPAAGFGVSPWLLAVVASLAFALGHGAQGQVGVVVTGVLGLALAAGYILTGSLLVVVVAHYVINALEFLLHEFLGIEVVPSRLAQSA